MIKNYTMKKYAVRLKRLQSRIDTAKEVLYADRNGKRTLFDVMQELKSMKVERGVYVG
tara:strand:- start:852 stop:1025 length:174 start_codon:yes stop_codon:yes gene_type:complete